MARALIVVLLTVILLQPIGAVATGPAELNQIALHQRLLEAIDRGVLVRVHEGPPCSRASVVQQWRFAFQEGELAHNTSNSKAG